MTASTSTFMVGFVRDDEYLVQSLRVMSLLDSVSSDLPIEHSDRPHYVWLVAVKCEASRTTEFCNLLKAHVNASMTKFQVEFDSVNFKLNDAKFNCYLKAVVLNSLQSTLAQMFVDHGFLVKSAFSAQSWIAETPLLKNVDMIHFSAMWEKFDEISFPITAQAQSVEVMKVEDARIMFVTAFTLRDI